MIQAMTHDINSWNKWSKHGCCYNKIQLIRKLNLFKAIEKQLRIGSLHIHAKTDNMNKYSQTNCLIQLIAGIFAYKILKFIANKKVVIKTFFF